MNRSKSIIESSIDLISSTDDFVTKNYHLEDKTQTNLKNCEIVEANIQILSPICISFGFLEANK